MVEFAAFNAVMICDDKIQRYGAGEHVLGYEFKCKYPSYRGAYVCNIKSLRVFVDGKEIAQENIRFGVNNKWLLLSQIPDIYTEYWFTGAKATIRVLDDNGIAEGTHSVKMILQHSIPYTGYFGDCLVLEAVCEKQLAVENA